MSAQFFKEGLQRQEKILENIHHLGKGKFTTTLRRYTTLTSQHCWNPHRQWKITRVDEEGGKTGTLGPCCWNDNGTAPAGNSLADPQKVNRS